MKTSYFGAVGLFAVIYYASGIPRVQRDILQVGTAREYSCHGVRANKPCRSSPSSEATSSTRSRPRTTYVPSSSAEKYSH